MSQCVQYVRGHLSNMSPDWTHRQVGGRPGVFEIDEPRQRRYTTVTHGEPRDLSMHLSPLTRLTTEENLDCTPTCGGGYDVAPLRRRAHTLPVRQRPITLDPFHRSRALFILSI